MLPTLTSRAASKCAIGLLLVCCILISGCQPDKRNARYNNWRASPAAEQTEAYFRYLQQQGVAEVLPPQQLLRSGRRWQRCQMAEFEVPPQASWPSMARSLRVIQQLQRASLLPQARAVSVYRNPEFNRCEGGASKSRHVLNNAIDFDLQRSADNVQRLCTWWRSHGPTLNMGLGFYAEDKIHIDTSGFRTWGYDFSRKTSLCNKLPSA